MGNWFEENPSRSVVVHTIIVGGAVWAAFAFVFDESKIAVYRAQAENEKATAGQYKAKTEVLEVEIARLRDENKKYLDWMVSTPNTIPYLEQRIKALNDENSRQKAQLTIKGEAPKTEGSLITPYSSGRVLNLGDAFVDPKTHASLGIGRITADFSTSVVIALPGQKPVEIPNAKPGSSWNFLKDNKQYQMTLSRVDWFSNKAEVQIREVQDLPYKLQKPTSR